jgi:hypothetical protein
MEPRVPAAEVSICNVPPSSSARSRMDASPTPDWCSTGMPSPSSTISTCNRRGGFGRDRCGLPGRVPDAPRSWHTPSCVQCQPRKWSRPSDRRVGCWVSCATAGAAHHDRSAGSCTGWPARIGVANPRRTHASDMGAWLGNLTMRNKRLCTLATIRLSVAPLSRELVETGTITLHGLAADLIDDDQVRSAYFGVDGKDERT